MSNLYSSAFSRFKMSVMFDWVQVLIVGTITVLMGCILYVLGHDLCNYVRVPDQPGTALVTGKVIAPAWTVLIPEKVGNTMVTKPAYQDPVHHLLATVGTSKAVEFRVGQGTFERVSVGSRLAITFRRGRLDGEINVTGYQDAIAGNK